MRFAFYCLVFPLALQGCVDRPSAWTAPLSVSGPHHVGDRVMWADGTRGLVWSLDPAATPPSVTSVLIAKNLSLATPTPARGRLLVLTAGHEATKKGETTEKPRLTVLSPVGPKVENVYELPAAFDRISVSSDEKQAIVYFSDDAATGGLFRNANELALIDLTAPPDPKGGTNPRVKTIRSLGSAPIGIVFSPPVQIPAGSGSPRMLGLVLSKNYVTFLDLSHGDRPEITVPLAPTDAIANVIPKQVLFGPDGTAYVRADGAADVYALGLDSRPSADPTANDFRPRVNQPSSGHTALDMLLFSDAAHAYLLTPTSTNDVALIDTETGEAAIIPIGFYVDTVLGMPAINPTTAIVFARQNSQSFVHLITLKDLAKNGAANLTHRPVAGPTRDLVPIPGSQQLLVVHDDLRTIVSVLDLGPRRADTPIQGRVGLDSFDFAGGFLVGCSTSLMRLGLLDLSTESALDLRLDYLPKRVIAVGSHIVVDHGAPEGLVTIVPDPTATRADARVLWGFLLGNVLSDNLGN